MRLRSPRPDRMQQKTEGASAVLIMVLILLLLQLWLLNIAMEAFMAANNSLAVPTFLASAFCFALTLYALKALASLDKEGKSGR